MSLFDNPTTREPHKYMSGEQRIYEFDNGFRASVINGEFAHGEYELAVMDDDGLRYDTVITPDRDVVGYLDKGQVEQLLLLIKALEWSERVSK